MEQPLNLTVQEHVARMTEGQVVREGLSVLNIGYGLGIVSNRRLCR